jgi:hypothetical protein
MPVAVTNIGAINRSTNIVREAVGLTSGSGQIFSVPKNCVGMVVETIPTSAGTATFKVSVNPDTPAEGSEFTNFSSTAIGAMTATLVQELPGGLEWVGLEPASGTWTLRVRFLVNPEVY